MIRKSMPSDLIRGWVPVFPRDKREAFARRSCSNKKIERNDDSKKCHPALGGEPDLTGRRRVVTGEFRGPLLQPFLPEEADQRLNLRPEIAALPHQQIEILPGQR